MVFGFDEAKNCNPCQKKNNRIVVKYLAAYFSGESQWIYASMEQANPVTVIGIGDEMMLDIPDDEWRYYN